MDNSEAKEELSLRLHEAELELKAAEEEYDIFLKQLVAYRKTIDEHKESISMIKSRMVIPQIQ
ncbi:hypothetical protein [Paenibacillus sp. N3.4]|uniref:hypothetical protein n=1 Tax=Paenibacillus sp. N3.4 TaxID=2603222 RepID=UPI0011CC6746|nr:hypothetical protein [Paenibacillus sp. N3.4]TXK80049.1 hypothetical protein FU659_18980 [Paenibacillus sp. N3.4]